MNHKYAPKDIAKIREKALFAFWKVVAKSVPEATGGDLDWGIIDRLDKMADYAIEEWISENIPNEEHRGCLVYLTDTQTVDKDGAFVAQVGWVDYGTNGYNKTTWGLQTQQWVDWYNVERLGNTLEEAYAMMMCSMFKVWDNFEMIMKSMEGKLNYEPVESVSEVPTRK